MSGSATQLSVNLLTTRHIASIDDRVETNLLRKDRDELETSTGRGVGHTVQS